MTEVTVADAVDRAGLVALMLDDAKEEPLEGMRLIDVVGALLSVDC